MIVGRVDVIHSKLVIARDQIMDFRQACKTQFAVSDAKRTRVGKRMHLAVFCPLSQAACGRLLPIIKG